MTPLRQRVIHEADLAIVVARRRAREANPVLARHIDSNLRRAKRYYSLAGMTKMARVVVRFGRRLASTKRRLWPGLPLTIGEKGLEESKEASCG